MFADTADGMHKFIGDAEIFYERINSLKVDGFESAIKFVQDEIDKLSQYQNRQKFDYQTLSQEASRSVKGTDGVAVNLNELMAAQFDYIKTFGNASTQQMGVWEKNLDALTSGQLFGQPLQDFATQLASAVSNIGIVDVEGQLATLNQLLPGLSNQLADASKGPNGLSADQIRQNAVDEYNKYQGLIDATKDGGTISAQLFNSLNEDIQGFFDVAGVGIYKLKDDAQGFEQAVNKISLDSLRQGIEDLEIAKAAATLKDKGVNIQGASAIMKGAYVTYSNEAKIKNGVSKLDINVYGVYSEEVAKDMAEACKKEYGAYIGVGVTGVIDRPDPNNATKNPAIYYAICVEDKVITKKFTIPEEYQDRLTRKIYAVKIIGENLLEVVNNPELVREPLLIERDGIAELTKWR